MRRRYRNFSHTKRLIVASMQALVVLYSLTNVKLVRSKYIITRMNIGGVISKMLTGSLKYLDAPCFKT